MTYASTSTGEVTVDPVAGAQIKTVLAVELVQVVGGGGVLPEPTVNVSDCETMVPPDVQPFTVNLCVPAAAAKLALTCGFAPPVHFKVPSR